jgi:hypothetical protein
VAKRVTPAVSSRNGPSSERASQALVSSTTSRAMPPTTISSRRRRSIAAKASAWSILAISAQRVPGMASGPHDARVGTPW